MWNVCCLIYYTEIVIVTKSGQRAASCKLFYVFLRVRTKSETKSETLVTAADKNPVFSRCTLHRERYARVSLVGRRHLKFNAVGVLAPVWIFAESWKTIYLLEMRIFDNYQNSWDSWSVEYIDRDLTYTHTYLDEMFTNILILFHTLLSCIRSDKHQTK